MTKNDLIQELAVSEKIYLSTATKAVDGIIRILKEALVGGQQITLRGFGTLAPVKREQRSGIDFRTKEPIIVPAHTTVKFKPGNELRQMLNK